VTKEQTQDFISAKKVFEELDKYIDHWEIRYFEDYDGVIHISRYEVKTQTQKFIARSVKKALIMALDDAKGKDTPHE
jgi:hypothetical protein